MYLPGKREYSATLGGGGGQGNKNLNRSNEPVEDVESRRAPKVNALRELIGNLCCVFSRTETLHQRESIMVSLWLIQFFALEHWRSMTSEGLD